jgi:hypothetical protein
VDRRSKGRLSNKALIEAAAKSSEIILRKIQGGGLLTLAETAWTLSVSIEKVYILRDCGMLRAAQATPLLFDPADFAECRRLMKDDVDAKRKIVLAFKENERRRIAWQADLVSNG